MTMGGQVRASNKVEFRRKPDPAGLDIGLRLYGAKDVYGAVRFET